MMDAEKLNKLLADIKETKQQIKSTVGFFVSWIQYPN